MVDLDTSQTVPEARITALVLDPQVMVAEGVAAALVTDGDLNVSIVKEVDEACSRMVNDRVDVVVLGCGPHLPDGAGAIERLLRADDRIRVIVLSATADYTTVMQVLEAGASGFLLTTQRVGELADAIRTVHAGGRALAAELVNTLVDRLSAPAGRRVQLTTRELDVLGRLADGASTAAIATDLALSVNTVRNHVQSAIRRLGAHSKLEAISIARREGLVSQDISKK